MRRLGRGVHYRIRTLPSGERVRIAIAPGGHVVSVSKMTSARNTKARSKLSKRLRRIGL